MVSEYSEYIVGMTIYANRSIYRRYSLRGIVWDVRHSMVVESTNDIVAELAEDVFVEVEAGLNVLDPGTRHFMTSDIRHRAYDILDFSLPMSWK